MKKLVLALGTITAVVAGPALAQTEIPDADGDGMYSMEELLAVFPDLTEETFTAADANGDGMLDADELAAAQASGAIPS